MSSLKSFENRVPIRRRKKELGILIMIGISLISTIFLYSYVFNSPLFYSNYPRIDIRCEENPNYDNFINCTFELRSEDPSDNIQSIESRIKIRGSNTNWNEKSPKKGYRLELSRRESLLGLRTDDDWILMEMYYDSPRMRIKLSFDLWRSLDSTDPTAILPESKYVILYINNEIQGLYLLAERNDRRLFQLDDSQDSLDSSLIFQLKGYSEFRYYDREHWEQDYPNEGDHIMDEIMTKLIAFVNNTPDDVFFDTLNGIYSKFDKINLVDFYIFNFFILHLDFWHGNYFIIRNTYPEKLFLIPWDFDFSFGQFGGSFYNPETNPENDVKAVNKLYERLLNNEEFLRLCRARWQYLREELWTEEFILDKVSEMYEEIKEILNYEASNWDPSFIKKGWKNTIEDSVDYLFEWIPKRLEFCDLYFSQKVL